jgi:hypothetical protein
MSCTPAHAQADSGCPAGGYRILARTWDVVLKQAYELRQSCAHPDWPARSVAVSSGSASPAAPNRVAISNEPAPSPQPLLVHAGDPVRLWMQSEMVRIEISGQAEQSARNGERVIVRVTRPSDEGGVAVERIPGIVRGAGDVEMER